MATLTDADLRKIREEVGSSPSDSDLEDLWAELGTVPAVALAVLRPRLADALTAAAQGSTTIPGVISVGAPAQPAMLRSQIARLEGLLDVADPGTSAGSLIVGRRDRVR